MNDYGSPEDDDGTSTPPPQPADDANDADCDEGMDGEEEEHDSPRTQLIKANIRLVGADACAVNAVPLLPRGGGGRSSLELWRRRSRLVFSNPHKPCGCWRC